MCSGKNWSCPFKAPSVVFYRKFPRFATVIMPNYPTNWIHNKNWYRVTPFVVISTLVIIPQPSYLGQFSDMVTS